MNKEEWKPIKSSSGIYEASSFGRIRRKLDNGETRLIKPFDSGGYLSVSISTNNNSQRKYVHSLVCEAFHGERPSKGHVVAHYDGNSINNAPDNLRWATYKENEYDKKRHGKYLIGTQLPFAKLNEKLVEEILLEWSAGGKIKPIARRNKVTQQCIQCVVYGRTWPYIRPDIKRKQQEIGTP